MKEQEQGTVVVNIWTCLDYWFSKRFLSSIPFLCHFFFFVLGLKGCGESGCWGLNVMLEGVGTEEQEDLLPSAAAGRSDVAQDFLDCVSCEITPTLWGDEPFSWGWISESPPEVSEITRSYWNDIDCEWKLRSSLQMRHKSRARWTASLSVTFLGWWWYRH